MSIPTLKAPQPIIDLANEYFEGKHPSLDNRHIYGLLVLSTRIHNSIYNQINQIFKNKNSNHTNKEVASTLNKAFRFNLTYATLVRFLGSKDSDSNTKGYARAREHLVSEGALVEEPHSYKNYDEHFLPIRKDPVSLDHLLRQSEIELILKSEFIVYPLKKLSDHKILKKVMDKRLASILGNYQPLQILTTPPDRVKGLLESLIENKNKSRDDKYKLKYDVEIKNLRYLNERITSDTFGARKSFQVKRSWTELTNLMKMFRSLLFDKNLKEQLVEVDYHAMHPMILKAELWKCYSEPSEWAEDNLYAWDKSNKMNLEDFLKYVQNDSERLSEQGVNRFIESHPTLIKLVKEQLKKSHSRIDINFLFKKEFDSVFEYQDDFYQNIYDSLCLGDHQNFSGGRNTIKPCLLQLLHGQQWRSEALSLFRHLKNDLKSSNIDLESQQGNSHKDLIENLTSNLTESQWDIFFVRFTETFPILALTLSYFQYCVSMKDLDAKKGHKFLGFSRMLFAKEVELIEDVVGYLRANTNNDNQEKRRSFYNSMGINEWNGSNIGMYPIYDCVSVPTSITVVTKRVMEKVAELNGYDMRADISEPLIHLEKDEIVGFLKDEEARLSPKKNPVTRACKDVLKGINNAKNCLQKAEKKTFSIQINKKGYTIRKKKQESEYDLISRVGKKLIDKGVDSFIVHFIQGHFNPLGFNDYFLYAIQRRNWTLCGSSESLQRTIHY